MLTIVAGMSRSGSTWMYQVMTELLQRKHGQVQGLGYRTPPDPRLIEPDQQVIVKWHTAVSSSIVRAPRELVRIIYSYRDLRDVAYSYAYKGLTPLAVALNHLPTLLDLNAFWESMPLAATMRYEQFWLDPRSEVIKLADLVDHGWATTPVIEEILAKFSFEENKKRTKQASDDMARTGLALSDLNVSCSMNHQGLLHWNHLRKGVGGEWRTADEATLRQFDRMLTLWLIRKRYEQHYTWVDQLLAARRQGGRDGEEAKQTQADGERECGSADSHSATGP
jgi:hypothetical protein